MALGDGVSAFAQLGVTFGGFSPTAMDGVEASRQQVERAEQAQAERKALVRRQQEIERARASAPKSFTDEQGMTWTYVVMDGAFIRIERCKRPQSVVAIPSTIENLPVRALGSDIFNESEAVIEIVCSDEIEAIGACAFRNLVNLRRVVFPKKLATFSHSWLQQCWSVEEIVLPGLLDELVSGIFDSPSLRTLYIGAAVMGVRPGACEKTQLDAFVIAPENSYITSDGDAIYTHDMSHLIALARPVKHYRVAEGCTSIGRKAFMGIKALKSVELPNSLTDIGPFAFAHTGLTSIEVPASVTHIQEKAFYFCGSLEEVMLHEGLVALGNSVFENSALKAIAIPASIEHLGTSITAKSQVIHSGSQASFSISADCPTFFFDGEGGLYRREESEIHFVQLIDQDLTSYRVYEGTTIIRERAFAFNDCIERVSLPEGVRELRANAFRVCARLRRVDIPESLRSIGKEAFLDTVLESLYLPAGLEELADDALITAGAHHLGEPPSLCDIRVHPDNANFYVDSGLLCRRGKDGVGDRGIVFADSCEHVVIPDAVTSIADMAFCNARNIETISIGPNLKTIGTGGLSTWCYIKNIHIQIAEAIEGRSTFDIRFPDTSRTAHEISISLGGSAWINVPDIMRHYDNCVAHAHDYHVGENTISAYEQACLILARLKDPYLLIPVNKSLLERVLREHLLDICVDIARHDDRAVMNDLCDLGFVNSDNLEEIIVAVGRLQDAAMSGYLLELKRVRFGRAAFDFDL